MRNPVLERDTHPHISKTTEIQGDTQGYTPSKWNSQNLNLNILTSSYCAFSFLKSKLKLILENCGEQKGARELSVKTVSPFPFLLNGV